MAAKRFPLLKRFNVAMSEEAYANLRALNGTYGYGNNYLLTVLLENLERIVNQRELAKVFSEFAAEYGTPASGQMKRRT